ncbi:hypothetical protein AB6A40_000790 [Gnathostoma spinigerum]|uniref:O-acyltransferase n=1 Tax=Gnathostoma spinigerum TaxID=75299 RepID=A0ABD6E9L4_9BILA
MGSEEPNCASVKESIREVDEPKENSKKKKMVFWDKKFTIRPSLLTILVDETDFAALHNFFIAIFILAILASMIDDTVQYANPFYHMWLIFWNFQNLTSTLIVWCLMAISIVVPYTVLLNWSNIPTKQVSLSTEWPMILLYVLYLFSLFFFPLKYLFAFDLNPACSFIITCESTRIAMKVHSFVRENVPRAIRRKLALAEGDIMSDNEDYPTIQQLYYHFFCPSFIYRDEYPQVPDRRWKIVLGYFVQVLLVIAFVNIVFTQMVYPLFHPVTYQTVSFGFIASSVFRCILPGLLCLLLLFYGLLHCWLNMFSEILRFGDRHFYVNWWNSRTMAEYYRNWNLVVHDWLYTYVYRDIAMLIGGKRGLDIAQTAVFFLSAAFHEYWFGVSLRMFYPVMFTLYFVFGGLFFFVSKFIKPGRLWNTTMWLNLLIGTGMFVSFYSQEWYARRRCSPPSDSYLINVITPRHFFCSS